MLKNSDVFAFLMICAATAAAACASAAGAAAASPAAASGTTWTGFLVGARDGAPQKQAQVEASYGGIRRSALTGERGEFVFPALSGDDWEFRTALPRDAPLKPAMVGRMYRGEAGNEVMLLHGQGVSLGGQVVDASTSAPVADLSLELHALAGGDVRTTATDEKGVFLFENVDSFSHFSLRFDDFSYAYRSAEEGRWVDQVALSTKTGHNYTSVSISLMPRVAVPGQVVGPDKKPVAEAEVLMKSRQAIEQDYDDLKRPMVHRVISNADGRFSPVIFPPGSYEITAYAPPLASETYLHEAFTTSTEELLIELKPVRKLRGRTVDWTGAPLAGCRVEMETVSNGPGKTALPPGCYIQSAVSDFNGGFTFEGVFPERVLLSAAHPCFNMAPRTEVQVSDAGSKAPELKFPPGKLFSAHVTDRKGSPLPGARLQIFVEEAETLKQLAVSTGEDGFAHFALSAPRVRHIVVEHDGFAPFRAQRIALPQERYEVRLEAELKSTPAGRKLAAFADWIAGLMPPQAGGVVAGRTVVAGRIRLDPGDGESQRRLTLHFSRPGAPSNLRRIPVESDGKYAVSLEPGSYTVSLVEGRGVAFEVPDSNGELVTDFDYVELAAASGLIE